MSKLLDYVYENLENPKTKVEYSTQFYNAYTNSSYTFPNGMMLEWDNGGVVVYSDNNRVRLNGTLNFWELLQLKMKLNLLWFQNYNEVQKKVKEKGLYAIQRIEEGL